MKYSIVLILALLFAACGDTGGTAIDLTKNGKSTDNNPRAAESFDTVAYFTVRKAIKGLPQFSLVHDGAEYVFSSKENRDAFEMNPEKYIPGYGSYCPVSLSKGLEEKGKPTSWRVYKDRIYWFFSDKHAEEFDQNPDEILRKADENKKD